MSGFCVRSTFALLTPLLSLEPGAGQRVLPTDNVADDCLLFCRFVFVLHVWPDSSPPRGTVGTITFHLVYLLCNHILVSLVIAPKCFLQLKFFVIIPAAASIRSEVAKQGLSEFEEQYDQFVF